MWPFKRTVDYEFLRLGRYTAERWSLMPEGLTLIASGSLNTERFDDPEMLAELLRTVYAIRPNSPVGVVLESAWAPVILTDKGGALSNAAQVEGLLRHRLRTLYASAKDNLEELDVRATARPGNRFALGYGLSARVKQAVLSAASELDVRVSSMTPAFAWGWSRLNPSRDWPNRTGWWLWPEQDRLICMRAEAAQLVALNPAVACADTAAELERVVQVEAVRWGLDPTNEPIHVAAWAPPAHLPAPSARVSWRSVASQTNSSAATRRSVVAANRASKASA